MNKPCSGNRNAKIQQIISVMLIGAAFFLGGCATTGVTEQQNSANKADPYENLNRKVFVFNDAVDDYVAAPISNAYKWITPQFMQTGVFNFFSIAEFCDVAYGRDDVTQLPIRCNQWSVGDSYRKERGIGAFKITFYI